MKNNTIAFLTRSLVDATGCNMWRGLVSICKKENVPLVTFRGPVLNKGAGSIIYHLFSDKTFAGVISWASSDVTSDVVDYYKQFKETKLVCMTFQVSGHPVIYTDCTTGMLELMDHLIEHHGFKKIAFVRGPVVHVYAKERYEAYLAGLKKHGLGIDEKLISEPGGWSLADGEKAVKAFMERGLEPGKDFEAIVCVGDNVAIGAQECLIHEGYSVPFDVAVCGFNGTDDAAWCNPPITSVEMPFFGLGIKSFTTIKDIFEGKPVPSEFRYTTKLKIAESCGCKSESVQNAAVNLSDSKSETVEKKFLFGKKSAGKSKENIDDVLGDEKWVNDISRRILDYIFEKGVSAEELEVFFKEKIPVLVSAFAKSLITLTSENSRFILEFSKALGAYLKLSLDFGCWQNIISILNKKVTSVVSGSYFEKCSENLLQQARVLVHEFDVRTQKQKALWDSRYDADLRATSAELLSSYEVDTLLNILQKSLGKLKIPGVYIVLYENCKYNEKTHEIPEKSKLIMAVRDGERVKLPEDGYVFNTQDILPDQFLPLSSFYSLVVESLHFQNSYLGYIVFQEGPDIGGPYAALRDQLSSSLYGALILEERNKNRVMVEDTMRKMTEKADVVSSKSKQISGNIATISTSMEDFTGSVKAISENIQTVTNTVKNASEMMSNADESIRVLVDSTNQISVAINKISDIAETTNVLALNASIEASHAGDAGRGFSVVAKEVKLLAAQTVSATEAIQELVIKNSKNAIETKRVIDSTNIAVKRISQLSEEIRTSIGGQVTASSEISAQIEDASAGTEGIYKAIEEIVSLGDNIQQ